MEKEPYICEGCGAMLTAPLPVGPMLCLKCASLPTPNSAKRIRRWWRFWLVFLGTPFLAAAATILHPILMLILAGSGSIAAGFLLAAAITRNSDKQLSLGIVCWLGVAVIYLGLMVVWFLFGSHIQ